MADFIRRMNWELLRKQKQTLVRLAGDDRLSQSEQDDLDGLTYLIDAVQDWAVAEQGVDEDVVFPSRLETNE